MDDSYPTLEGTALESVTANVARSDSVSNISVVENGNGERAIADWSASRSEKRELRTFWAATPEFIDLSWPDVAQDESYSIRRDGTLIANTDSPYLRDLDVQPGQEVVYEVSTTVPIPESEWDEQDRNALAAGNGSPRSGYIWSLTTYIPDATSSETLEEEASSLAARIDVNGASILRYRIFIASEYVQAPPLACTYSFPNHKYGGDNRGFSATAPGHRVMIDVTTGWGPTLSVTAETHVGTTHVYDQSNNLVTTGVAQGPLDVLWIGADPGATIYSIEANISDPFCNVGAVSANFTALITQAGSYSFYGNHRAYPHHEVYIRRAPSEWTAGTSWKPVYQKEAVGLECLVQYACPLIAVDEDGISY